MRKLTTDQLVELTEKQKDVTLISVLPEEKFSEAHIPGSENIPLKSDDFIRQVESKVSDKNKKVVVYDEDERSDIAPAAVKKLEQAGFSQVFDFSGGMNAWKKARLPFETGSLNTHR